MASSAAALGSRLARTLGIKLDNSRRRDPYDTSAQEPLMAAQTAGAEETTPASPPDWLREQIPSQEQVAEYGRSLFPFLNWIGHYNLQWFAGDLVAGITIGAVVVPQGMAYASLARLEPQFGLYSSFIGVLIYWIFGTSKDISIGPVAVLSTIVGNVVHDIHASGNDVPAHVIASALSVIAGLIVLMIGLLRCGWIVDLISITSLSAFMTGSAVTICVGQVPALLGLTSFSNRESPYKVVVNTLTHLDEMQADAIVGLSALVLLYVIRSVLTDAAERYSPYKRIIFFANTMRTVALIILYTMISWGVNGSRRESPMFRILGAIPQGFQNIGIPSISPEVVSGFSSYLPATVIVLLVEHIAISKSFGRVNDYTIDPSQEMVAIGMTNILGPLVGAYPTTGSFSRTAIQSKAGVRTPAAGIVTAMVVLLATYFLTDFFFYIPTATLSAVIIHAVGDLVTPPATIHQFWQVSPVEVFIFFTGVIVSILSSIEQGLYSTVSLSAVTLFYRILKAKGQFLGRVKVHSVLEDQVIGDDHRKLVGKYGTFDNIESSGRNVFLPIDRGDGSNPELELDHPFPGIFVYRFSGGFNYPNANSTLEYLTDYVQAHTRRTSYEAYERAGDRPWNKPGPKKSAKRPAHADEDSRLPTLKAVILDFSSVESVDITSIQRLIDIRNQLDAYSAPGVVDWHISCINNKWIRHTLLSAGFGVPPDNTEDGVPRRWKSIFSVAEVGTNIGAPGMSRELVESQGLFTDEEMALGGLSQDANPDQNGLPEIEKERRRGAVVHEWDSPLFHIDLTSALQSAIANVEARLESGHSG